MQYLDTMAGLVDFILSRDVSVFIEMVTSYPDMDGIKVEYIAEALSDLKSYMSDIIAPCEGIRQSALIHLKMMSENADYLNLLFDNPRMFHLGFKSLHTNTPYTERNRNFSAGIADVLPGEMGVEFYSKNQLKEMQEDYKAYKQKLEESDTKIHDVGVQVYRNVQAVIEKSQDKSKEDIKDLQNRLETLQVSVETKNSALLPLTIITMVLVIADLVFNILRFLGII